MNSKVSRLLYVYGAFLVFIGALTFLTDHVNGRSALIVCTVFGALSLVWGFQIKHDVPHSVRGATLNTGILIIVFTWRAALGWQEFFNVGGNRILSAAMVTLLMPASIVLFLTLNRARIENSKD